ncbi:MAG: histidine phosphatase family protein [Patescibacteria group bacterium]|jgi:hypothetical protein
MEKEQNLGQVELANEASIESEAKPRYQIYITRHAERLPSGELTPEGIAHAKAKGEAFKDVEVLKQYASDHPSGRAYETAENIGGQANVTSLQTDERYKTRKVKGIQYDQLPPNVLKDAKLLIEGATLAEIYQEHVELAALIDEAIANDTTGAMIKKDVSGQPMVDIEKLPKDIQLKIGPIRQKHQKEGFQQVIENPEAVNNLASDLSHQLIEKQEILARYASGREKKKVTTKKDVVININTHGLFAESLLKTAGIFVRADGTEIHGIADLDTPEFGGYIQPAESIILDLGIDPNNTPERIPVIFEGRQIKGRVYLDKSKLQALDQVYRLAHQSDRE